MVGNTVLRIVIGSYLFSAFFGGNLVNVRAPRTAAVKYIDFQVVGGNFYIYFFRLRQDCYRGRRGMNPAGSLGNRHALNTMHAAFVFQSTVSVFASHFKNNFLEAANAAFADTDDIGLPALFLGIAAVHTIKVGGKQRPFIASRTRPDFPDDAFLIIGVFGQS